MEISAFGVNLRVSGRTAVLVLVALAFIMAVLVHDWQDGLRAAAVIEEFRGVKYILTLSESERKQLRLTMPDGMRERIKTTVTTTTTEH